MRWEGRSRSSESFMMPIGSWSATARATCRWRLTSSASSFIFSSIRSPPSSGSPVLFTGFFIRLFVKPCPGLPVFFPEIDRKHQCAREQHGDQREPEPCRDEKKGQDGYRNEKDDDIQLYCKPVELPPELVFGFRIHHSYVDPGIKVLDVSLHIFPADGSTFRYDQEERCRRLRHVCLIARRRHAVPDDICHERPVRLLQKARQERRYHHLPDGDRARVPRIEGHGHDPDAGRVTGDTQNGKRPVPRDGTDDRRPGGREHSRTATVPRSPCRGTQGVLYGHGRQGDRPFPAGKKICTGTPGDTARPG